MKKERKPYIVLFDKSKQQKGYFLGSSPFVKKSALLACYNPLTNLVNFPFKLAAFLLCHVFLLANLSIIELF